MDCPDTQPAAMQSTG